MEGIFGAAAYIILIFMIFGLPVVFTLYETALLVITARAPVDEIKKHRVTYCVIDTMVIFAAAVFEAFYLSLLKSADFSGDWQTQLYNEEMHNPVYTGSVPTLAVIILLALAGYYVLNIVNINETPPLIPVLAMASMYPGLIASAVFAFHVFDFSRLLTTDYFLLTAPLNFMLTAARVILLSVREYEAQPGRLCGIEGSVILSEADKLLSDSKQWPLIAFILMLPMLGVLVCVLMLFGQAPDSLIRAFTETADFNLSQMIPPQNIYYDEHYLCTVAAGGDRRLVRPLRMGVRHGHRVVVNRQLMIANAFEQVLEERTPGLHSIIRGIYDKYGFPLAGHIKSRYTADIIYILMKPFELLFLTVIYLNDVHPEDRIAMQYTGKTVEELMKEKTVYGNGK